MLDASLAPTWHEFFTGLPLFYWQPILCSVIAGLLLGVLGIFIVLRRMVFVPLAVTNAAGLGVTLAFDAQIHLGQHLWTDPVVGAFVFGVGTTLLLAFLTPRLTSESLIGMIYILAAGGAVLASAHISQESHEISAILFGTAVVVSTTDLYATAIVGATVLAACIWLRRGLVFASFDRDGARVQGLPVRLLDTVLFLGIGFAISVTTRALGAMPVFAMAVLPAMASLRLFHHVYIALWAAAVIGALVGGAGYVASFFLSYPVGATQAVVAGVITLLAMVIGARWRR